MEQFKNALRHVLLNGSKKTDRTGVGTISSFGYQMRFNLQEGFPATTTKKLAWKAVVSELLWFLEGSNDERRLCEILYGTRSEERTTIWSGNANADYWRPNAQFPGDLQRVYGVQWRTWDTYHQWKSNVELIKQGTAYGIDSPFHIDIPLEKPVPTNADDLVGKIFPTKDSGDFIVLQKLPTKNNNSYYRIQFLTGIHTIIECSRPNIRSKSVKNPYAMTVVDGNGCYGIIDKKSPYLTKAYNLWYNMMARCHGTDPIKTIHYKTNGVFVDSNWRCFSNFYRDIHNIVGFDYWKDNPSGYDLDKDYFGNTFYSKSSTIFLPTWYNQYVLSNSNITGQLYIATNNFTGEKFKFTSPALFNQHTKSAGLVDRALREQNGRTKNWSFTKEDPPAGYKWRQKFYVDQIAAVLKSLKDDPFSRRHIVSAWNPGELNDAALPPCHALFQFNVRHIPLVDRIKMSIKSGSLDIQTEGQLDAIGVPKYYLDCQLYQRSCDMFLGVPFNIASYSLLIHMFAKELNYAAGDFVWTGGDCHIYATHLDAVHELLDRECRTLPTLEFNKKDLANYKVDDFKLVGYDPHPVIKAPMAV